jgi:branched-chain amino acid transport system permease protein
MGFAGLVSIGHAGFAAIGAYVCTLLMVHFDVPYLLALPLGAIAAAISGVAIGVPALRLSPLYIAMVTFGFGQAVNYLVVNWIELTRGPNGMTVPEIFMFGVPISPQGIFVMVVVVFALLLWLSWNIRRTRMGRAFMAVRDSTIAAQSMGIPVAYYKTVAFAISAFYGGMAGGLYAAVAAFINPDAFTFGASIMYVTMNVVGGLGTLSGPLLGALVLTLLTELLRPFAEYKEFLTGIVLLLFLVLMPSGLIGLGRRALDWLRQFRTRIVR